MLREACAKGDSNPKPAFARYRMHARAHKGSPPGPARGAAGAGAAAGAAGLCFMAVVFLVSVSSSSWKPVYSVVLLQSTGFDASSVPLADALSSLPASSG